MYGREGILDNIFFKENIGEEVKKTDNPVLKNTVFFNL